MIRFAINNIPVPLKTGTSFKLTRENPLLTDSGDYTFDITLPIECPEVLNVFGPVHRPENRSGQYVGKRFSFSLLADELHVSGTCVITSITNDSVKVQLLAGRSESNLKTTDSKCNDLYVDELDLGSVWDDVKNPPSNIDDCLSITEKTSHGGTDVHELMYGDHTKTHCVCYPIYSSSDDKIANERQVIFFRNDNLGVNETFFYWPLQSYSNMPYQETAARHKSGRAFAGQPYLYYIMCKVLAAIGSPVSYNILEHDSQKKWMLDIFIANASSNMQYSKMLPHWTVKEFLDECCKFFGVYIDSERGKSSIKNKISQQTVVELTEVLYEFSVEIDEEEQASDVSVGNVGFAYPEADNYGTLPKQVWDVAKMADEDTFDRASDEDRKKMLVTRAALPGIYAYIENGNTWTLTMVNQCAPYLRNEKSHDVDSELRIVPVAINELNNHLTDVYSRASESSSLWQHTDGVWQYGLPLMSTAQSVSAVSSDDLCISDYLQGQTVETDSRDYIEVALRLNGETSLHFKSASIQTDYPVPVRLDGKPICYDHNTQQLMTYYLTNGTFDISKYRDKSKALFSRSVIESGGTAHTKAKHCFSFIDRKAMPLDAIYHIRGKRYLCEKIEYTVTEDGLSSLKKGYFYEL